MTRDKDPFDILGDSTLQRAEELCSGLGTNLSLDRRGKARFFRGALTDLDDPHKKDIPVTVAEIEHVPWFTLISDQTLPASNNALLVFRMPPSKDMKYIGKHAEFEPGKRGEQDQGRFVVRFNIIRDARKS